MKRKIFIPLDLNKNRLLKIEENEIIHRIKNVYRLKEGEKIIFVDKNGYEGTYELIDKNKFLFQLKNLNKRKILPQYNVNLYLSFIKKENFELILEKSFELGIMEITPLIAERSSWYTNEISERWNKILLKGLEIAEWNFVPKINKPIILKNIPYQSYVLDKNGIPINKIKLNKNKIINLIVGPEGGFSSKELTIFKNKKCYLVSIAKTNLKTETAVFVAISLINFGNF
jgi:16S rRNA (uracil1498-N3)-methyltransferase